MPGPTSTLSPTIAASIPDWIVGYSSGTKMVSENPKVKNNMKTKYLMSPPD